MFFSVDNPVDKLSSYPHYPQSKNLEKSYPQKKLSYPQSYPQIPVDNSSL